MSERWHTITPDVSDPAFRQAWDALAGVDEFYLSGSLGRTAALMCGQQTAHVAVVGRGGRLLGMLPAYVLDERARSPYVRADLVLARLGGSQANGITADELLPELHCGSRQVGYSRPLLAADLHPDLAAAVLTALLQEAVRSAPGHGARSVSMVSVDEDRDLLRMTLRDLRFAEFHSGWTSLFDIAWPDFAGYLATRSPGRRSQVLRERAKLSGAGVTFTVSALDPADAGTLAGLEAAVHRRHGNPQDTGKLAAMLAGMADGMAGRTTLFRAWQGFDLLGFALFLRWRDRLHMANVGMDHTAAAGLPLYFGLAFYEPIAHAAANGISSIDYGQGTLAAKQSRGCRLVSQFGYLHCVDPQVQQRIEHVTASLRNVRKPDE